MFLTRPFEVIFEVTFDEHLKYISDKTNKTVALLRKLENILPRPALSRIYKCVN